VIELDRMLGERSLGLEGVIHLTVPTATLIARLAGRAAEEGPDPRARAGQGLVSPVPDRGGEAPGATRQGDGLSTGEMPQLFQIRN